MIRGAAWRRNTPGPLDVLQHELNRLFDEYWTGAPGGRAPTSTADLEGAWAPDLDLLEEPDAYLLEVELPGVDPSAIDLSLTGETLTLRGAKGSEGPLPPALLRERRVGPFHRQVTLPGAVDFEKVQAQTRHGVLQIRLPKRQADRPRVIPVRQS